MPKTSIKDQNGNITVIAFHTFIMNSNLAALIGQPGSYKLNRPHGQCRRRNLRENGVHSLDEESDQGKKQSGKVAAESGAFASAISQVTSN